MSKKLRIFLISLGVAGFLLILATVIVEQIRDDQDNEEDAVGMENFDKDHDIDDDKDDEKPDQDDDSEDKDENEESSTAEEIDVGTLESLHISDDIGVEAESGPFELEVEGVHIMNLETNEQGEKEYDGKDNVGMVFLHINVENTSDDSVTIHPAQGSISTNTKEQVDANLVKSDDVGGEFHGNVEKSGVVLFELDDSDAEDIEEITYHVNGGTTGGDVSETITLDDYDNLAQ